MGGKLGIMDSFAAKERMEHKDIEKKRRFSVPLFEFSMFFCG